MKEMLSDMNLTTPVPWNIVGYPKTDNTLKLSEYSIIGKKPKPSKGKVNLPAIYTQLPNFLQEALYSDKDLTVYSPNLSQVIYNKPCSEENKDTYYLSFPKDTPRSEMVAYVSKILKDGYHIQTTSNERFTVFRYGNSEILMVAEDITFKDIPLDSHIALDGSTINISAAAYYLYRYNIYIYNDKQYPANDASLLHALASEKAIVCINITDDKSQNLAVFKALSPFLINN